MTKAIRPGVVSLERNSARNDEKRMEDGYGHAREAFGHASHHEDALVAINRHWCPRRTARHIVCHIVHYRRCRNFIRHRRHRSLRWCPRHDRPGNRRHDKARDHQDREQPTYGEIAVHRIKLSQTSGDKKATSLKVMELYLSCIDRYQVGQQIRCPKRVPGSTDRRSTGVISLCGGFKLQGLTWPFVELTRHFVQIGLRVHRKVGALGEVTVSADHWCSHLIRAAMGFADRKSRRQCWSSA